MHALHPETLELAQLLDAGVSCIWIHAVDERRALALCEALAAHQGWPLHLWSATTGLDETGPTRPLEDVLHGLGRARERSLCVFLDAHRPMQTSPLAQRTVREWAQGKAACAIFVDPVPTSLHEMHIPEAVTWTLPAPAPNERMRELARLAPELAHDVARCTRFAHATVGLQLCDLPRVWAITAPNAASDDTRIAAIAREKPRFVAQSGLLEASQAAALHDVGGLAALKSWLVRRKVAFSSEAAAAGIDAPRGVLLLGVQGCGKSLAARMCAGALELPLVRLEPGRLFGGTLGQSEAHLRAARTELEQRAPVVAWIDEIDKGLASTGSGESDAGTSARLLGALLTWLQERTAPVFIVATANRVDNLPPELLRRGRLDDIFFIDLPSQDERADILRVHLLAHERRTTEADLAALAREASGFSGAELRSALLEARLDAFAGQRALTPRDLERALAATVPLSTFRREEVAALRAWAQGRARSAHDETTA